MEIRKKQTLTDAELSEIEQLITICNNYEGLHMRIGLDMLRTRPGNEMDDFLYYSAPIRPAYPPDALRASCAQAGRKEREII